jgi:hypothetical protein
VVLQNFNFAVFVGHALCTRIQFDRSPSKRGDPELSQWECQLIQVRWMWMGTIRLNQQHQQRHPQQKLCLFGCLQEVVSFAPRLDCIYSLHSSHWSRHWTQWTDIPL